jgi:hypothetical protein
MNILKLPATSLLALLVTACGGGGGSAELTPANPDAVFQTSSAQTPDIGELLSFNLTGKATGYGETESLTGSISLSRKPNQIINDEELIVVETVFAITILSQGTSISTSNTTYSTLDGSVVVVEQDDGVICYPDSNYREIPDTVEIGDAGDLGGATCTDGTTLSGSYLVEVSGRNNAWAAVRNFATYSEPGSADLFEDIVYHITEDGQLKAVDIVAGDGEFTFELSS